MGAPRQGPKSYETPDSGDQQGRFAFGETPGAGTAHPVLNLVAAIASTTTIAILIRFFRSRDRDMEVIIASNYIVAAVLGWLMLLATGTGPFGDDSVGAPAIWLGLIGGGLWPAAFHLYAVVVGRVGLALSGAWARMSLAVPVLFGLAVLREPLTVRLTLGMTVLVIAFVALSANHDSPSNNAGNDVSSDDPASRQLLGTTGLLFTLIAVFGLLDLWVNLFNNLGSENDQFVFLVILFSSASVLAWLPLLLRQGRKLGHSHKVESGNIAWGLLLGIPNFGASWFLLRALATDTFSSNSTAAYSIYSASSLVLLVIIGIGFWQERLSSRQIVGVGGALIAIVLLTGS